jgi:hypothetical protein
MSPKLKLVSSTSSTQKRKASKRPIAAEYMMGNTLLKVGRSANVANAIVAAVKTLAQDPRRYRQVFIYSEYGLQAARAYIVLHRGTHAIHVQRTVK